VTRDAVGSRSWIVLLGLASGLSTFGMASLVPGLPALATALQTDFGAIQFVLSVYLLALGLAQPVQGLLCDRFGRRPVLLAGFTAFALASAAAALAASLSWLILARFIQALGASVGTVVARAMVRDTHEPERAAVALAFITAVMGIAPIIAPIAGGVVVEAYGWRSIFVMHAVIATLLVGWMAVAMRETRAGARRKPHSASFASQALVLMRDPRFRGHTLLFGFGTGAIYAFLTVGAALFEAQFGMGPTRFGVLWALLAAAFACGAWLAATGARRFGSDRVLLAGVVTSLAGTLVYVLAAILPTPQLGPYMLALTLLIAGNGIISPLALAGAISGHPELAGLASGLSSSLAMLIIVGFAAGSGALYQGTSGSIAVLVVVGAVGMVWATRVAVVRPLKDARR